MEKIHWMKARYIRKPIRVVEKIALDLGVDIKSLIGKEELITKVDVEKIY